MVAVIGVAKRYNRLRCRPVCGAETVRVIPVDLKLVPIDSTPGYAYDRVVQRPRSLLWAAGRIRWVRTKD
jgi:hypothetical protein